MRAVLVALFVYGIVYGQTAAPVFEVASVKTSAPEGPFRVGCSGGPGTTSPGIYRCDHMPMAGLLTAAYDLKPYQLPASVTSIFADRYDIEAKVPAGATRDEMKAMLRNLLAERFKLSAHFEKKEMAIYALVQAKNGSRLKVSGPAPDPAVTPPPPAPAGKQQLDGDGYPVMTVRRGQSGISMANGRWHIVVTGHGTEALVSLLNSQLDRPVIDGTGLKGEYDIDLKYATDIDAGPTVFEAIQRQLGLKLESRKGAIDVLVVDHVEKTPLGN